MIIQCQDEVIAELWTFKDQFAKSSEGDIGKLVMMANRIATEKGFKCDPESHSNHTSTLTNA